MRILLDEMIPVRLRLEFAEDHVVETVEYNGWKGVVNGAILPLAREAGYECLVTRDHSIPAQQNLFALSIAVVVVSPRGQDLDDWREIVPRIEQELSTIRPGEMRRITAPPPGTP